MSKQQERFLAIVNPAAGGGKSAKLAGAALKQLRENELAVDVIATTGRGHAVELAAEAYSQGYRRFLAVGGDGTAHEILNGLFCRAKAQERVSLGFLPLGTGNSFLRDFAKEGADASLRALLERRTRPVDLIRLTHSAGELYSLNILSIGFTADVGALTNRYFKSLGPLGYLLGVLVRVTQLKRRSFTLRCDDDTEWDNRRSLFLTFNNSKYTGGNMLIAPQADSMDGYIEFVRWGPIGRFGLLRTLPRLYDGSHIGQKNVFYKSAKKLELRANEQVLLDVDGEQPGRVPITIEIVPSALKVVC